MSDHDTESSSRMSASNTLNMSDLPPMVTARDAAQLYQEHPKTMERRCREGNVAGAVKPAKQWLIPRETIWRDLRPDLLADAT